MSVREYLVGVTAAALFCGVVKVLLPGKGAVGAVIRVLLGVMMILAVARPWLSVRFDAVRDWTQGITPDAQTIVADAEGSARDALRVRIKEECEAYILAKARSLGAAVEVTVQVSEEMPPAPIGVTVSGNLSPHARQSLTGVITHELGIAKEGVQWNG